MIEEAAEDVEQAEDLERLEALAFPFSDFWLCSLGAERVDHEAPPSSLRRCCLVAGGCRMSAEVEEEISVEGVVAEIEVADGMIPLISISSEL